MRSGSERCGGGGGGGGGTGWRCRVTGAAQQRSVRGSMRARRGREGVSVRGSVRGGSVWGGSVRGSVCARRGRERCSVRGGVCVGRCVCGAVCARGSVCAAACGAAVYSAGRAGATRLRRWRRRQKLYISLHSLPPTSRYARNPNHLPRQVETGTVRRATRRRGVQVRLWAMKPLDGRVATGPVQAPEVAAPTHRLNISHRRVSTSS